MNGLRRPAAQALRPLPQLCIRQLHNRIPQRPIPEPTPFVPDVPTFLTLIGRKLSAHASKIPDWAALFSLSSEQLRELGVEPPRSRRYLLHWREKFRNGEFGIAGDAKYVHDGAALVHVVEHQGPRPAASTGPALATATASPGARKLAVNVPSPTPTPDQLKSGKPLRGISVHGAHTIVGPHVEAVKGGKGVLGRIVVKEGLWEERRGHKIDGGERRKAEVRAKRRAEANRT